MCHRLIYVTINSSLLKLETINNTKLSIQKWTELPNIMSERTVKHFDGSILYHFMVDIYFKIYFIAELQYPSSTRYI